MYAYGASVHVLETPLWRAIDVAESFVKITPAKVEISLAKALPGHWLRLHFDANKDSIVNEGNEKAS